MLLSSLLAIILLWATGLIAMALFTFDDDDGPPKAHKDAKESPYPHLGGELQALEDAYSEGDLEIRKAVYLKDHPLHKRVVKTKNRDGTYTWSFSSRSQED